MTWWKQQDNENKKKKKWKSTGAYNAVPKSMYCVKLKWYLAKILFTLIYTSRFEFMMDTSKHESSNSKKKLSAQYLYGLNAAAVAAAATATQYIFI